jgi:hypothetical protein
MSEATLYNAVRKLPPTPGAKLALVAATPSAATATGTTTAQTTAALNRTAGPGWYSFAVSTPFSIAFSADGSSTITDPTDTQDFPAGVYDFWLTALNSHFKITAHATGDVQYWKSSQNDA